MILSKKTRYAMVALARLARDFGKGPIQIRKVFKEVLANTNSILQRATLETLIQKH